MQGVYRPERLNPSYIGMEAQMKIVGVEVVTDCPGGLSTLLDQRPLLFRPIRTRGVTAKNRIMLGPMSQYLAIDGKVADWHLVHLGQFAIGGAGIVCSEGRAHASSRLFEALEQLVPDGWLVHSFI